MFVYYLFAAMQHCLFDRVRCTFPLRDAAPFPRPFGHIGPIDRRQSKPGHSLADLALIVAGLLTPFGYRQTRVARVATEPNR
jgi:hypothetical protein